jgi:hypothetical protein
MPCRCASGRYENRGNDILKEVEMAGLVCDGDHSGHICVLASNQKFDEIKTLTQNPQFICFNCGRVADCKENLCNPMPLKE